jgi:hypothetical protein
MHRTFAHRRLGCQHCLHERLASNQRRAEAAAVSAMASGSQHMTIANMRHRIACSAVPPRSCATYMIGAAYEALADAGFDVLTRLGPR